MKTLEITLYKFDELSNEAQETAIAKNWGANVYYEWWDSTYEDAKRIGLKITSFDIDRLSYLNGSLLWSASEVSNAIIKEHGEVCETYSLAKTFLSDYNKLVEKYSDGINKNVVAEDNEYDFDQEADDLESEFLNSLREEYLSILRNEFDYLSSAEAIKETLISNEYDFTENGENY